MEYFAAIEVSLELSSVCVVETGKIICEKKVASEPEALVAWLNDTGLEFTRIGPEAGKPEDRLYARQGGGSGCSTVADGEASSRTEGRPRPGSPDGKAHRDRSHVVLGCSPPARSPCAKSTDGRR